MGQRLGIACLALAAIFFALCLTSLWSRPNEVAGTSHAWDRLDLDLYRETPNYAALLDYARAHATGSEEQRSIALLDITSRRFAHGLSRESLLSSYPAFAASLIHPAFGVTFAPDRILGTGNAGFCSQQTYILTLLADDLGIRARQAGLNGHVVAELWYGGRWHMFDPDYELFVRDSSGNIASVRELAREPRLLEAAYDPRNAAIPPLYRSREDNNFISYPVRAYFDWKSNVLLYVSIALNIAKWVIPVLLLILGLFLRRRRRTGARPETLPNARAEPLAAAKAGPR